MQLVRDVVMWNDYPDRSIIPSKYLDSCVVRYTVKLYMKQRR